jgi:two-component system chemotaxis response regulator CheY
MTTILLVDDSKAMRMIVRRSLGAAGFAHARISEAAEGKTAFEMIRADRPDLVISDWNMPGWTGLELLQALNQAVIRVRFGFLTSESTPQMRRRAAESGALFLVTKPFTPDVLATALARVRWSDTR